MDFDDDGDGVYDLLDAFSLNFAASSDYDGDGMPDNWNRDCDEVCIANSGLVIDEDDDNDGQLDSVDAFSMQKAAWLDADEDGRPDEWSDTCDLMCQVNSGLELDLDDDNDGVSDDIDPSNGEDNGLPVLSAVIIKIQL